MSRILTGVFLGVCVIALWSVSVQARAGTVVAYFDGGDSDLVVDGLPGMAGNGWQDAWIELINANGTGESQVLESGEEGYAEIKTGWGNYLDMKSTTTAPDSRYAQCRDYVGDDTSEIIPTLPHTIEFTVRINEDVDSVDSTYTAKWDRYMIEDYPYAKDNTGASQRWVIAVTGEDDYVWGVDAKEWHFKGGSHEGTDYAVPTGISITTGGVYDFTIDVDPTTGTWSATISDGVYSFTEEDMGWRDDSYDVGGFLCFTQRGSDPEDVIMEFPADTRDWSVDNIVISQESVDLIPGDTDMNNIVNEIDAAILSQNWGIDVGMGGFAFGDFNGDQVVNSLDAAILAANWGDHNPPSASATAVPEPASMVFLLVMGLAAVAARHLRQ